MQDAAAAPPLPDDAPTLKRMVGELLDTLRDQRREAAAIGQGVGCLHLVPALHPPAALPLYCRMFPAPEIASCHCRDGSGVRQSPDS